VDDSFWECFSSNSYVTAFVMQLLLKITSIHFQ
jgi:hypothetical protein